MQTQFQKGVLNEPLQAQTSFHITLSSSARLSKVVNPNRQYNDNECLNYMEVTNSPTKRTKLDKIYCSGEVCKV